MSQRKLKRKYLKKAQLLLQRAGKHQKLQASVGPIRTTSFCVHQGRPGTRGPVLERSYSDPTTACSHHGPPVRTRAVRPLDDHDTHGHIPNRPPVGREVDPFSNHRKHTAHYPYDDLRPSLKAPSISSRTPNSRIYRNGSLKSTSLFPNRKTSATFSTPLRDGSMAIEEESGTPSAGSCDGSPTAGQLRKQIEVNKELKRLLIASVGNDLQLRLDQMVQEKAQLSHTLSASMQQLAESSEDLDRVSIECDVWRTKYLASRVMIDELASWKAELSLHFRDSLRALQCLLTERKEVMKELLKCHSQLSAGLGTATCRLESQLSPRTQETSSPLPQKTYSSGNIAAVAPVQSSHKGTPGLTSLLSQDGVPATRSQRATVVDVASANTSMARAWLLAPPLGPDAVELGEKPRKGWAAVAQPSRLVVEPTQGEKLANQVLRSRYRTTEDRGGLPLPLRLNDEELVRQRAFTTPSSYRHHRFPLPHPPTPFTSYEANELTVPFHCNKCKGRVLLV